MFQGETILSGASPYCCGKHLQFDVLKSGGGYYIGTWCERCGPYSRESHYFQDKVIAERELTAGTWEVRT